MIFTQEELSELARADAEIDAGFVLSDEEISAACERDRMAAMATMTPEQRKHTESQRRYRAAHKDEIAERQRRYRATKRSAARSAGTETDRNQN